jgi:ubiquinone/menaquinone biosynthesis C-methylase UbiE
VSQSAELQSFYGDYYNDEVAKKRAIAAVQSVDHIQNLCGDVLGHILDIGAGDGAVLEEIERRSIATSIDAVEISSSGIERIESRKLKTLRSIQSFDGYKLPYTDTSFDTALAIHVLEHVEHERLFLRELARVARRVYIEVPLEHTFRLKRSIAFGKPFGHINHYTFDRFLNVLATSGLKPVGSQIFANSLPYEAFVGGKMRGYVKYAIRSGMLAVAPALAPKLFVYLAGALCEPATVPKS